MTVQASAKKSCLAVCLAATLAFAGCSSSDSDEPRVTSDVTVGSEFTTDTDGADVELADGAVLGAPNICSVRGINAWIYTQMRDYYIYFDQVPMVDPDDYSDPAELLADLRVSPDDFSSVSSLAQRESLFQAGETFGFGFRWRRDQQGALRFSDIISGSPISELDVQRGDRVLAVNGVPELDLTDNLIADIFGEGSEPTTVTFTLEREVGVARDVVVTSSVFTIKTVGTFDVFEHQGGTKSGYLELSTFLRTSEAELDNALAYFVEQNINDLILDFRYNGGGFVYIAQKLAAQLAGSSFTGRTFQSTSFNSRYQQFNETAVLEAQDINLDLPRLIILTTTRTASAAEAVANNLKPYIDVVLIGETTRGKPFASVSNANCDLALNAMDRITSNDVGETVLGGLNPTCEVRDEFRFPRNNLNDALTGAAMTYIETGACPANPGITAGLEFRASVVTAPIDSYTDFDVPIGMFDR